MALAKTIAKKESPEPGGPDSGDAVRKRLGCGVDFGGLQAGKELDDDFWHFPSAYLIVTHHPGGDAQGVSGLGLGPP